MDTQNKEDVTKVEAIEVLESSAAKSRTGNLPQFTSKFAQRQFGGTLPKSNTEQDEQHLENSIKLSMLQSEPEYKASTPQSLRNIYNLGRYDYQELVNDRRSSNSRDRSLARIVYIDGMKHKVVPLRSVSRSKSPSNYNNQSGLPPHQAEPSSQEGLSILSRSNAPYYRAIM